MSIVSLGFALTSYVFAGAYLALHLLFSLYGVWLLEKFVSSTLALAIWLTHTHTQRSPPPCEIWLEGARYVAWCAVCISFFKGGQMLLLGE